jgi:hypothetical protein
MYTAILFLNGGDDDNNSDSTTSDAADADRPRVRGGEFAWLDKASDRFDMANSAAWAAHGVEVVRPKCGRALAMTTTVGAADALLSIVHSPVNLVVNHN